MRTFSTTKYVPFIFSSVEHETNRAILIKIARHTKANEEVWLPKSQIIKDKQNEGWIWVASWLCKKNDYIPAQYKSSNWDEAARWNKDQWQTASQLRDGDYDSTVYLPQSQPEVRS